LIVNAANSEVDSDITHMTRGTSSSQLVPKIMENFGVFTNIDLTRFAASERMRDLWTWRTGKRSRTVKI